MFKKFLILTLILVNSFAPIANASLTPVSAKFVKDWKKNQNTFAFRPDNAMLDFENDDIKVHINGNQLEWFMHWDLGNTRKHFVASHTDGVYHAIQAALGGTVEYLSATGVELDITNKTDEVMYIDLNKSVISIGTYQGRPMVGGSKFADSQTAPIPPIVILPKKTIAKQLYRADYSFVKDGAYGPMWVPPCDLSVGKNVFGDGTFIIAIGDDKAKFVPMNFYREIDYNSIAGYVTKK